MNFIKTQLSSAHLTILLSNFYKHVNSNKMTYRVSMVHVWWFSPFLCNNKHITPHSFTSIQLHSDLGISEIVNEITMLLPQFANFINQFNTTINQSGVNVVSDTLGNLSIDVPQNMSDDVANKVSSRIGILDRLITTRSEEIQNLLQKGAQLENKLKTEDSNYVSQLADKVQEFRRLNALYKH